MTKITATVCSELAIPLCGCCKFGANHFTQKFTVNKHLALTFRMQVCHSAQREIQKFLHKY